MAQEKDFRGEWNRQPFSLENERTGELLDFKRVKIDGISSEMFKGNRLNSFLANQGESKLVLALHRHPKVGPLQSIERRFTAVVQDKTGGRKTVKFYNLRPNSGHRRHSDNSFYDDDFDEDYFDEDYVGGCWGDSDSDPYDY